MNPMMAAIKKRKMGNQSLEGDHQDMTHHSSHTEDADNASHLHDFVSNLSHSEKQSLKAILEKDKGSGEQITKGNPSSEEKGKIAEAMQHENAETDMEQQEDAGVSPDEHDEIGKSMLDSRYLGSNPPSHQPRNLGERVKMDIHKKLKEKGKV